MRSLLLIINPVAGRGTYKNGLGEALHVLHSAGYVPTVRFTTHAGEAVELAAGSAGYDQSQELFFLDLLQKTARGLLPALGAGSQAGGGDQGDRPGAALLRGEWNGPRPNARTAHRALRTARGRDLQELQGDGHP